MRNTESRGRRRAQKEYSPSDPGLCAWPSLLPLLLHLPPLSPYRCYSNGEMGTLFYQRKPQILTGQQLWEGEENGPPVCQPE